MCMQGENNFLVSDLLEKKYQRNPCHGRTLETLKSDNLPSLKIFAKSIFQQPFRSCKRIEAKMAQRGFRAEWQSGVGRNDVKIGKYWSDEVENSDDGSFADNLSTFSQDAESLDTSRLEQLIEVKQKQLQNMKEMKIRSLHDTIASMRHNYEELRQKHEKLIVDFKYNTALVDERDQELTECDGKLEQMSKSLEGKERESKQLRAQVCFVVGYMYIFKYSPHPSIHP